jgi:hypothetical protein
MSQPNLDAGGQGLGVFHRVGITPQTSSNPSGAASTSFIEIGWVYDKYYGTPDVK